MNDQQPQHRTGAVRIPLRLCDGMVRARFRDGMDNPHLLQPHRVYEFNIDLWNTSQLFLKGHRIGLQISSSAFPKYDRNLNNGEDLARSTRMVVARQVVYHDAQRPSALLLPLIPRDSHHAAHLHGQQEDQRGAQGQEQQRE